jgi:Zn finger protein HypA/HybF involved in hydrogenase expression
MHELGITQGIIDRARETALANDVQRVTALYLAITPAADFTEDAIAMYFEMLSDDDELFRGARLHFERGPAAARCLECGHEFDATERHMHCPHCGSLSVMFDASAPMVQLTGIDVDDER